MSTDTISEAPGPDISDIMTDWILIREVHDIHPDIARAARERLHRRYGHAIQLYLRKALRGRPAADDIYQEFAIRLCEGRFKHADPDHGKFRKYLKTSLHNLVNDHYRREPTFAPLPPDFAERSTENESGDLVDEFNGVWRDQLLARAWEHLKECERMSPDRPYATVLGKQVEDPDLRRADIAAFISKRRGKPVTDQWIGRLLHEARVLLQERIIHEVQLSLDHPTLDNIESELADLQLLRYCRKALEHRRARLNEARNAN